MLRHILYAVCACLGALGAALPASALEPGAFAASSALAEGKWVKVAVDVDGLYLLTPEQLKNMGFADPSKVNVYGRGGTRLPETLTSSIGDDLQLLPVARTSRGIIFYGTGTVLWGLKNGKITHQQNPYSTQSCYFVSDRDISALPSPAAPLRVPYGADDRRVTSFPALLLHEVEAVAPGNTGGDLFGEDFRSVTSRTFSFGAPDAISDTVSFNAAFAAKASDGSTVTYTVGGAVIGSASIPGTSDGSTHTVVRATRMEGTIADGKAEIGVDYAGRGVVYNALLDYIEMSYQRRLALPASGELLVNYVAEGNAPVVLSVSGCVKSTVVWDVTDPDRVTPVDFDLDGSNALFAPAAAGLRRYMVFNPEKGGTLTAKTVATLANQDLHALPIPNLLIITPKEYKAQAERVAQMHRDHDAMTVHVLTDTEIFNEFSSGTPDATAFRRICKMWYDRSASLPQGEKFGYCLLFGRPTYDQRKLSETVRSSSYPRLLTRNTVLDLGSGAASLTESNSYCADTYFACLEDDATSTFSLTRSALSIGVGRMPVKSLAEARAAADKLIKYVQEPELGSWRNQNILLADDGDNAIHALQTQKGYENMMASGAADMIFERLYIDAYELGANSYKRCYPAAKARLLKMLDEGVGLWEYIGHANTTSLTADDMWNYTDVTSMTNVRMPVFYSASCEFVRFDDDAVSGCETMWLNPSAGIIAAIAANRKVYIANNGLLTAALGRYYFARDFDGLPSRLGDAFRNAVNAVGSEDNKHRFALMGDPAMRIPSPRYSVKVESLAGVDVQAISDAADYPVVPALSKVAVTGSILLPDGTPATDFNGYVVPTLYDAEIVVTTKGHDVDAQHPDGKQISYNDRKNKLFTGSFPVKDGRFSATLLLPEEIENNYTQARLTLYAYSDDGRDGAGSTDHFYVYGWDESAPQDTKDPEIEYAYLNNAAFRDGATLGPDPVFRARVFDESGINISTTGIGRLMTVLVDGDKVYDNVADYFTTDPSDPRAGTVAYTLTGLGQGAHTLDFLVWDNAGNSARTGMSFTIADASQIPDLAIYTDASPAVSSVTFYIDAPEARTGLVEVFDLGGRRVWSADASQIDGAMASQWNLCDKSGTRVPRGIYLYRATVTDATGAERRATKKFAVANP